jgi:G1/S-specific cyclin PLC1
LPCTRHRVFLACLITAAKYLNDSAPRNKNWAGYARMFEISEINLMESQLLYLLDYDLRFNELEACMMFAPLMSTATHQARAEAVDKVTRASKARAMAQAPTTPPCDRAAVIPPPPVIQVQQPAATTSALASAVRGIAKRLSSTHLRRPSQPPAVSSMYSAFSAGSSASATDSEAGSLTDDSGSSCSSSESGALSEPDEGRNEHEHQREQDLSKLKKLLLRPSPIYTGCDRRRKVSDSSVRSTVTIKGSDRDPSRRSSKTSGYHAGSYYMQTRPDLSFHDDEDEAIMVTSSTTMPSVRPSAAAGTLAAGFLSRMWGVAKGAQTQAPAGGVVVDIIDPMENQSHMLAPGHWDNALRRLVHSRSSVLRGGGAAAAATEG